MSLSLPVSYKDYNTPAQLRELTEVKLTAAGINEKSIRQLVISAFRKAGYASGRASLKRKHEGEDQSSVPGASILPNVTEVGCTAIDVLDKLKYHRQYPPSVKRSVTKLSMNYFLKCRETRRCNSTVLNLVRYWMKRHV